MLKYFLRRVITVVPTLVVVSIIVFALLHLLPGDPAEQMLGDGATPQALAALREAYGLDRPLSVQFLIWARHALHGDLGVSLSNEEPVAWLVWDRFKVSALIVCIAVAFASIIAVPAGMIAARYKSRFPDLAIVGTATLLLSIPAFWLGILLMLLFGIELHWLPVVGYVSMQTHFLSGLRFVILPVATLTMVQIGSLTRQMRASAIEVLHLEYVTHARAAGLPERTVFWRYVFPNAFGPTWTMIGLSLGHLLGGIAVIETVFTLPGLGRLLIESIFARDYPVVQGCLLLTAVFYVLANLIVDLVYPLFDPRVAA